MEICNGHFSATSAFKHPEVFVKGAPSEEGEFYGFSPDRTQEARCRIICAYLKVLENVRVSVAVDCELPFSKEQIGGAILNELAEDPESDLRRKLEIAYVLLESFIPNEEYQVIEDFKKASLCAQQIADMGDPTSILRSASMVRKARGDSAVRLQEKIYEKMRKRQQQIQALEQGSAA
ncbi:hypothetical protein SBDP1_230041 [Syntrophobacter sp. SbD1]|nr:hypothetical protein SBDP1_230041 [Syntrophobacter sp. SbD1]